MTLKEKEKSLQKFRKECKAFFDDIYKGNSKVMVFGEGNPDAVLVLVGEAPGEQETIRQKPFVGQAGKNLDEFLEVLNVKRDSIYITNVVKFRPFKTNPETGRKSNRPPNREEIELSRGWLLKELKILQPPLVVSLGNVALRALAGNTKINIGQVHGKPMPIDMDEELKTILFPLYHPASIIYKRELKETYLEDLKKLREHMKGDVKK